MSFGGHVLDMIKRNNQELRKRHEIYHQKIHAKSLLNKNNMVYPKIPRAKLEKLKTRIKIKSKRERQSLTLKVLVITIVIFPILVYTFITGVRYVILYLQNNY